MKTILSCFLALTALLLSTITSGENTTGSRNRMIEYLIKTRTEVVRIEPALIENSSEICSEYVTEEPDVIEEESDINVSGRRSRALKTNQPAFNTATNYLEEIYEETRSVIKTITKTTDDIAYTVAGDDYFSAGISNHPTTNTIATVSGERVIEKKIITTRIVSAEKTIVKKYFNVSAYAASYKTEAGSESYAYSALMEKALELKNYAAINGYSTEYAFIVNMHMKSGLKRFFVIDLKNMSVKNRGVVAHGKGSSSFTLKKRFSNEPGSRCTSIGMYKVGGFYRGSFGASFKLYGLNKTNNNAFKRAIVLHTMNAIPTEEIQFPIVQTEGCPAVAPAFLSEISPIIKNSNKAVLLWIINDAAE